MVKISHPSIMVFVDKLTWIYNFYYKETKLSIHNLFTNKYTNNKIIMKVLKKCTIVWNLINNSWYSD